MQTIASCDSHCGCRVRKLLCVRSTWGSKSRGSLIKRYIGFCCQTPRVKHKPGGSQRRHYLDKLWQLICQLLCWKILPPAKFTIRQRSPQSRVTRVIRVHIRLQNNLLPFCRAWFLSVKANRELRLANRLWKQRQNWHLQLHAFKSTRSYAAFQKTRDSHASCLKINARTEIHR